MIQKLQFLTLKQWVWLINIMGFVILGFYVASKPHYPLRPVLDAQPYEWPKGCQRLDYASRKYRGEHGISCECADPKYRIDDRRERGLVGSGRGTPDFYRVDADAVQIERMGPRSASQCRMGFVQQGFFQLNGRSAYQNAVAEANRGSHKDR
jgi:hypothetical protein